MGYAESVFEIELRLSTALSRFWEIAGIYDSAFRGFGWGLGKPEVAAQGFHKHANVFFEGWKLPDESKCKVRLVVDSDGLTTAELNGLLSEINRLLQPPAAPSVDNDQLSATGFSYRSSWRVDFDEADQTLPDFYPARNAEHTALRAQDTSTIASWQEINIGLGAVNTLRSEVYYLYPHLRRDATEPLEISLVPGATPRPLSDFVGARALPIRADVKAISVSPDGTKLATYEVNIESGDSARVAIIDLESNSRRQIMTFASGYYSRTLLFSPDGRWILVRLNGRPEQFVNIEAGWSAPIVGISGPTCWWRHDGRTTLLEIGEFDAKSGEVVDAGRMFVHDLASGRKTSIGSIKVPHGSSGLGRRPVHAPVSGPQGIVLVGIDFDIENSRADKLRRVNRVAVLDPSTGDIHPIVAPFADASEQVERVHEAWSWNSGLLDDTSLEIHEDMMGGRAPLGSSDDDPDEWLHWTLLSLAFDSPLLTGAWRD